jgi:hypothetical protein
MNWHHDARVAWPDLMMVQPVLNHSRRLPQMFFR